MAYAIIGLLAAALGVTLFMKLKKKSPTAREIAAQREKKRKKMYEKINNSRATHRSSVDEFRKFKDRVKSSRIKDDPVSRGNQSD